MPTYSERVQGELIVVIPQPILNTNTDDKTLIVADQTTNKNQLEIVTLSWPERNKEKLSPTEKVRRHAK